MESISLHATVAITGLSERAWRTRISERAVIQLKNDIRGREILDVEDIAPFICIPLNDDDLNMLLLADAGHAEAQNDIGQLFASAGKSEAALYWLHASAGQNNTDAMQNLGRCYIEGTLVPKDKHLGIMWIARAASQGHVIAVAQMEALLSIPATSLFRY